MLKKAFSIGAFAPPIWEFQMGHSYLLLRKYDEALARFHRTIERAPRFTQGHVFLAWTYVELDRLDDARESIDTALEITPHYTVKEVSRIFPFRIDESRDRFLNSLRKAGLPER